MWVRQCLLLLVSLSLIAGTTLASACRQAPASVPELQALISRDDPIERISEDVWVRTRAFYAARQGTLAWVDRKGASRNTADVLKVLHSAEDHGLDPASYAELELRKLEESLIARRDDAKDQAALIAEFDVRLTAALLELAHDVATGRLAPDVVDARWKERRTPPDYVAALQAASANGVETFLPAIQPRHPEYTALQKALVAMRAQVTREWPRVEEATLRTGQSNAAIVVPLRRRLATSGDLPENVALDSPLYDDEVAAAVKVFQEHHGLAATGRLDAATVAALNVPAEARVRQVEMNLERWRWLPDDLGERHFLVNVPSFHLIARERGEPVLDIRVVVGKRGNETPLFSDRMEEVVFSPYWNVPDTIAVAETAPAVARDPGFLARNNMDVVDARGRLVSDDAIPWGDEGALRAFRFRQRPGARNALGLVKFLFPNDHAVYLHDTPADALFSRVGRAFSHGCIRVEEPARLAEYVLRDQPEWTTDAIETAMNSGTERHVKLHEPIPVHIIYFTAWVDDNGGLHFVNDVYGYDARQARH